MPPIAGRAGFTGTRDGISSFQRANLLQFLAAANPGVLHHGDCVGADAEAHTLAVSLGIPIVIHPPEKNVYRAYCALPGVPADVEWRPRRPYLQRNHFIVTETDYLIACPKHNRIPSAGHQGGTWYTVSYALRQDRPVYVFFPDGRVDRMPGDG